MVGESGRTLGQPAGWRYDVALSFAGAQRDYVDEVAKALTDRMVRIFYDRDEGVRLWGRNLTEELPRVYGEEAASVVIFISAEYAQREWTNVERKAALLRATRERREYVLPARFDDTEMPGLLSDVACVDLKDYQQPDMFASLVLDKLVMLEILSSNANLATAEMHTIVERIKDCRSAGCDVDIAPMLNQIANWIPETMVAAIQALHRAGLHIDARRLDPRIARRSPAAVADIVRELHIAGQRGTVESVLKHAAQRSHDDISKIITALKGISYGDAADQLMATAANQRLGTDELLELAKVLRREGYIDDFNQLIEMGKRQRQMLENVFRGGGERFQRYRG